jgi:regulatory protein
MTPRRPAAPQTLRGRAIRLLAQREHSRAELSRKLSTRALETTEPAEDLETVLNQLEQCGLLSDARAAEAYVRSHASRFGGARLAHDLRTRGIDTALIATSLAQEGIDDELTRAMAVWRSKFGQAPRDAREWARQARFLQGRGFPSDVIRKLLKDIDHHPDASGSLDD